VDDAMTNGSLVQLTSFLVGFGMSHVTTPWPAAAAEDQLS
jgi:hypothetical protein